MTQITHHIARLAISASLAFAPLSAAAEEAGPTTPYTNQEALEFRAMFEAGRVFNAQEGFRNEIENQYYNLHWDDIHAVNIVRRDGPILDLARSADTSLAGLPVMGNEGETTLDAAVNEAAFGLQGFVVLQGGQIAYDAYPNMAANDNHIWYSVSKLLPATLLTLYEAQGRLDVSQTVGTYLPQAVETAWEDIAIIDVMDMASGLDVEETIDTMLNEDHLVNASFRVAVGGDLIEKDDGSIWTYNEMMLAMDDNPDVKPGHRFEYSSINTQILVMLVEEIANKRFAEALSLDLWAYVGAQGDGTMGIGPFGSAMSGGQMSSRLNDLARFGLIFTPSWDPALSAAAVQHWGLDARPDLTRVVYDDCRPELYRTAIDEANFFRFPTGPEIRCNSRQWDLVFQDGDMWKGGVGGQGLYVSPENDLVIAFFSTSANSAFPLARQIAEALRR